MSWQKNDQSDLQSARWSSDYRFGSAVAVTQDQLGYDPVVEKHPLRVQAFAPFPLVEADATSRLDVLERLGARVPRRRRRGFLSDG